MILAISATKLALVAVGALLDLTGIVLVAWGELHPHVEKARARGTSAWRRIETSLRLLLRRPRSRTVYGESASVVAIGLSGSGISVHSVSADATVDRKLEALIAMSEELQRRLGSVENRLSNINSEWEREIEQTRDEIERILREAVMESRDAHIGVRLWGIGFLLVGSTMLSGSNLLP
jgi:hypothetical protein